jgi:hypothetical protein
MSLFIGVSEIIHVIHFRLVGGISVPGVFRSQRMATVGRNMRAREQAGEAAGRGRGARGARAGRRGGRGRGRGSRGILGGPCVIETFQESSD